MRFSTVFLSSAFMLASMSAALPIEKESMLVARLADPGFLAEVSARAYDEETELYARARVPNAHQKDWDNRAYDDDSPIFPGIDPRPNHRTASTNGPSLHPHHRPHVSPSQVEARAYEPELYARSRVQNGDRDFDNRDRTYDDDSPIFPDIDPRPNHRNAPTNGHPRLR